MSVTSFIQDLGIIPNKRISVEKDPNILQGKRFMEYERMYVRQVEPRLKKIESTGIPGVKSINTIDTDKLIQQSANNKEELEYATILGKKENSELLAISSILKNLLYIIITLIIIGLALKIIICGDTGNKLGIIIALLLFITIFKR